MEKFFRESTDSSEPRSLVLQLDALSSAARLALTRHCCQAARARHSAPSGHIFLVQHRCGWRPEEGAKGYKWQPEVGWHHIFVDDLQAEGRETLSGSIKEFLKHSVHELQGQQKIPSLRQSHGV